MADNIHRPLSFLQNKQYPVFQLWAKNANQKTLAEDAFKISVLTVLQWLRMKYKDNYPKEIDYISPDAYKEFNLSDFKDFELNDGCIKGVYLSDEKSFSLRIDEIDTGNPKYNTPAVSGRRFITDVGFKIVDNYVEYGFKAQINEPLEEKSRVKYLRMGVVRMLAENPRIGLRHIYDIKQEYISLETEKAMNFFDSYLDNQYVHLPAIVFSEYKEKEKSKGNEMTPEELEKIIKEGGEKLSNPYINKPIFDFGCNNNNLIKGKKEKLKKNSVLVSISDVIKQEEEKKFYPYTDKAFLYDFLGYAHIFLLPFNKINEFNKRFSAKLNPGSVVIVQAKCYGKDKTYFSKDTLEDEIERKKLKKHIYDYIRKHNVVWKNVIFVNDALAKRNMMAINDRMCKNELIEKYEEQIKLLKQKYEEDLNDVKREKDETKKDNEMMKSKINSLRVENENKKKEFNNEKEKLENTIEKYKDYVNNVSAFFRKKQQQPNTLYQIMDWIESNFNGRIEVLPRTTGFVTTWKPANNKLIPILYDCIEYLGNEYYDYHFGVKTQSDIDEIASWKYGRGFTVESIGDSTVSQYPQEYVVSYQDQKDPTKITAKLNLHLKYGTDKANNIRIYFFFDDERKLLVIGSMPVHLSTTKKTK